jgi:hypothetical protein
MKLFRQTLLGLMVISGIATAFSACNKIGLPSVNVPLTASNLAFTIPAASVAGSDSAIFTYTINLDSLILAKNSSLAASNIKSITIDTVELVASTGNFNSIQSASLDFTSLSLPGTVTSIVTNYTISGTPGTSLQLPVNSTVNLQSYIAAGNVDTYFTFKLHATLSGASPLINGLATVHFVVQASL